jgi:site-specific DNA recombinase
MRAIEDLTEAGIEVWYYIENRRVTLATAMDKIMFAVQSGTSEAERDGISSRVFEALMVRARKTQNVGGRVYGYSNVPIIEGEKRVRTEYKINEEQAAIVREIFSMYAAGKGLRAIAIDLNSRGIPSPSAGKRGIGLWSSSALFSMLRRERYRGKVV